MNFGGKPFPVWFMPTLAGMSGVVAAIALIALVWLAQIALRLIG